MLLTMFLFQKWLGSSFLEDVWAWWLLMHWLQLQFTPCEALSSVWIGFSWQFSQACGHPCCFAHFSYPISSFQSNFACNMLWYSTPWTAILSVMTSATYPLCGGCQWSSSGPLPSQQCSPLFWFQRTRDTYKLYLDGHLLKLKCFNSNILRYWFLTSWSCKSLGYICSNSQIYIVWVKVISIFLLCQKSLGY